MKKRISFVTALLISVAMLASCGQAGSAAGSSEPAAEASSAAASTAESAAESIDWEKYRTVTLNMEGFGQVSIAEEGAAPAFDPDFPTQSAGVSREVGSSVTVAAKPDEGWKILKWMKNGENIGSDAEITNEITGSELTVTRDELKALAADYSAEVKRLRKRS